MTTEEVPTESTNMRWPVALKEAVKAKVGARGLTEFTLGAVETRLKSEDRVRELEKEVGQLRYLCQLLADRVAMGGDHEDRNHLLMEVELPSWMKTEGWPKDMKGLVPIAPPTVTKVYTEAELAKPAHQVAAEMKLVESEALAEIGEAKPLVGDFQVGDTVEVGGVEFTKIAEDPFSGGDDSDLFARIQGKAAEKGVDITGAGLIPASKLPAPHNHSYERREDGNLYCTGQRGTQPCNAWIDESARVAHEGEVPTEPAPTLEVQTPVPTPVAPAAPAYATRDLSDIEDDF